MPSKAAIRDDDALNVPGEQSCLVEDLRGPSLVVALHVEVAIGRDSK